MPDQFYKSEFIGDGIDISSSIPRLQKFLMRFWNHPLNRMEPVLEEHGGLADLCVGQPDTQLPDVKPPPLCSSQYVHLRC